MDKLSPEILHHIASLLSVEDATNFRLVNRNLSVIAGAYILPELSFHLHQNDFDKLRAISQHPVIARNVSALTYFAEVLDTPTITWDAFIQSYELSMSLFKWAPEASSIPAWKSQLSQPQLREHYEIYKKMVASQDRLLRERQDLACLKEVLPNFPALKGVTMSSGYYFYEGEERAKRSRAYKDVLRDAKQNLDPRGCAHMETLLEALEYHGVQIESLRAGDLSWRFFEKDRDTLSRLFRPLAKLREIELHLSTETDDNCFEINDDNNKCKKFFQNGAMRNLFESMPDLEYISLMFEGDRSDLKRSASLRDLFAPDAHWPDLEVLELGGIESDRRSLWKFMEAHKETLRYVCLQDVHLTEGSWKTLLRDIRHQLDLDDVCICGIMTGFSEDDGGAGPSTGDPGKPDERFDLSTPAAGPQDMRSSINMYCRAQGTLYPEEVPLSKQVVRKHYEEYVREPGQKSQAEDAEEFDRLMVEMQAKWRREMGPGPGPGGVDDNDDFGWQSEFSDDDEIITLASGAEEDEDDEDDVD
ncbi:hypothetical protein F4778DRAFT_60164 [Xylariomycetidae sp. FL2044]|nr:hypothetical protein F4778DRAFT_60164 [Xylariomycetidae sp. FL2044]